MRNKGFTLIELLAVIVILAIIALIATPIILGIINDTKTQANERSIEMYAKSLENSIVKYQLSGKELGVSKLEVKENSKGKEFENTDFKVEYEGNVECDIIEIYEEGKIYLANCKVNGEEIEYSYGEKKVTPESFATDSWETIAENINSDKYKVGDTKEVELTGFTNSTEKSTFTVRIANVSTPNECNNEGFSQTACGFVIEFVDIITKYNMHSNNKNVGGWKDSEMRIYINEVIYNALPKDLSSKIKKTQVVSSHGKTSNEENSVAEDKLYLLSTKEVWGTKSSMDTLEETRQLDYYNQEKVTISNCQKAIKKNKYWQLRSAYVKDTLSYFGVSNVGDETLSDANNPQGVAPAFRIG